MKHPRQNILPDPKQQDIKYGSKRIGNADYATSSHCVHRLIFHIVFVVKFRRQVLNPSRMNYLIALFPRIASHYKYRLIEVNGEADHIHFLLEIPPSASVSTVVARLKSVSSKFFLNRYGSQFWGSHSRTLWNSGYFAASTGGVTLEVLKKYVENQGTR
jgi:putative transposase